MDFEYPLTSDLLTMTSLLRSKANQTMKSHFGMTLNEYRIIASVEQALATSVSSLSKTLVIAPCKVSTQVANLVKRGILVETSHRGRLKIVSTTDEGSLLFSEYRDAIWSTYEELLAPLNSVQRDAFDIGCLATTTMYDGLSYNGQIPDRVYMCLRAFLLTELLVTETTNKKGLRFNEFRVLFALLTSDTLLTPSQLSNLLLMPKPTLSDLIRKLSERELLNFERVDGRSKHLQLTTKGQQLCYEAAVNVDNCFLDGVRSTPKSERLQYVRAAQIIVSNAR